jgi:predicted amidohydrolase
MPFLRLALLHAAAAHKQPKANRTLLLDLFRRAGDAGAQLALAPEMAISGYSFSSRDDIAPYTETVDGPTLASLEEIARSYGMYACIGLAEREQPTNMFYNSAFVLAPSGEVVCRYRKINAEHRWACPGNPRDDNTFATPWGRMGLLICSDSYQSLPSRISALRGADLLLIPANWPPTGLDPREIWRARAMENGIHVAACNRTGMDLHMDCRHGPSVVYNPQGTPLLEHTSPENRILLVDLPLTENNRLPSAARLDCLQQRNLTDISSCYLNLAGITDLTAFLRLPEPGPLMIDCVAITSMEAIFAHLMTFQADQENISTVHLLPAAGYSDRFLDELRQYCAEKGQAVVLTRLGEAEGLYWMQADEPVDYRPYQYGETNDQQLPMFDFGPARLLFAPLATLRHPEPILAAAKQGCDLALSSDRCLSPGEQLLAGVRTIDNIAVAVCTAQGGGIWITPEGHQRWEEHLTGKKRTCRYLLDTGRTRKKRFQDRVDYQLLLAGTPCPLGDLPGKEHLVRQDA